MQALVPVASVALLVLACGLAAQPVAATCHLPSPGHCDNAGAAASPNCPTTLPDGYRVECPTLSLGQQDAVSFNLDGIQVEGKASPTVLVEEFDGAHDFPIGSVVTLTFAARWTGNATHPAAIAATYAFDAHNVTWASAPGSAQASPKTTTLDQSVSGFPQYPSYPFLFTDFSGANTTFQWTFTIPETVKEGSLRIPVALALDHGDHESSYESDLVLRVASQEVSVIPPPPFWQDPSFILLVGVAIGLAVGFILFGKPKTAARRVGGGCA